MNEKLCSKCFQSKPIDSFSLVRGKHSNDRKNFCVICESKMKKARSQYNMTLEEMEQILLAPCFVCNAKSQKITQYVFAPLCKSCYDYITRFENYEDTLLKAYNFAIFKRDFPFWLRSQVSSIPIKKYPLLDLINEP